MKKRILSILCFLCCSSLLAQKEAHRLQPFIGGGVQHSTITFPDNNKFMDQLYFDANTGYIIKGGTDWAFRGKLKNAFLRLELSYHPTKYHATAREGALWNIDNELKASEMEFQTLAARIYANYHVSRVGKKGRLSLGVGGGWNKGYQFLQQTTVLWHPPFGLPQTHIIWAKYEPRWKDLSARLGYRYGDHLELSLNTTLWDSFRIDSHTEASQRIISCTAHYRF